VGRLLESGRLPTRIAERYPAELSGGELQRVAIARALGAGPDLIICDEISSALDVSVQAAVVAMLERLWVEFGLSLLFITHDLGLVATIADRVIVLESGVVCEEGATTHILQNPTHPYTRRSLECAPSLSETVEGWEHRAPHGDPAAVAHDD